MMKKIKMSNSNEYYMHFLYIYILTVIRYFYLIFFFGVNLMFLSINMYASYKYCSSIHVKFYSGNVRHESVILPVYIDYSLFWCAVKRVYLTSKKSFIRSHLFSPKDGAQIISNDSLLSTSDFS